MYSTHQEHLVKELALAGITGHGGISRQGTIVLAIHSILSIALPQENRAYLLRFTLDPADHLVIPVDSSCIHPATLKRSKLQTIILSLPYENARWSLSLEKMPENHSENTGRAMQSTPEISIQDTQQIEMAFALVEGKPVTQLPIDLYIPPNALKVILEAFEGPLDLLLYLIKRQNLDILNIKVAEITRQYMDYIELIRTVQLDLAADYLVMAALLAEIKSRMLLPQLTEGDEDEEDPRAELIRRLQEYERYKQAALDVDELNRLYRDFWIAGADVPAIEPVQQLPGVNLQEMLIMLVRVLKRTEKFNSHKIERESLSTRQRMSLILRRVRQSGSQFIPFFALFSAKEGRSGVAVTFLAMLELMKESLLEIVQAEPFSPIHIRLKQQIKAVTKQQLQVQERDARSQR